MQIGRTQLDAFALVAEAFRSWFSRFGSIAAVTAMITIPTFLVTFVVTSAVPEIDATDTEEVGRALGVALLVSFLAILFTAIQSAALTATFIRVFRGDSVSVGVVYGEVFERLGAVLIFAFVSAFIILGGFVAFIIPGLIFTVLFTAFGWPALMNERASGGDAVGISFRMIGGNWGVTFGVVIMGLIMVFFASLAIGGLLAPGAFTAPDAEAYTISQSILQLAASVLIAPLIPALATAIYFEVKGRRDGFPSIEPAAEEPPAGPDSLIR
ncbi:MAG: hypothetical protein HKN93_12120 [Acidimicrobiia bacterium]|nr:hypothetical protein [Acidimicrobiia bacterium]